MGGRLGPAPRRLGFGLLSRIKHFSIHVYSIPPRANAAMSNDTPPSRLVGDTPNGGSVMSFYARKGTPRPPEIDHAEGVYLYDTEGRRYMDITSGAVVSNIGHSNPRVVAAMQAQAAKVTFAYPRFFESRHNLALANRVCGLAGEGFDRAFFVSGGSEANESALKMARQYAVATGQPGRYKVISREPSYHGATLGALGVTGDAFTESLYAPMTRISPKVPVPLTYRVPEGLTLDEHAQHCAQALEDKILAEGPQSVLAFIMEPVGGLSSGAVVSPPAYYRAVRDICTRHGVLMIHDEIMSGAGRTGKFLSSQHWEGARPDMVTLAKGLAAGYTPFGAVITSNEVVDAIANHGGFIHGHTYFANPFSCAVADAVLEEVVAQDLLTRAAVLGERLRNGLLALMHASPIVGDVRGLGLLMAIELVADKPGKRAFPAALNVPAMLTLHGLNHGLALYNRRANKGAFGDMQLITPPLISTESEIDEMVELLGRSLHDLEIELRRR
jgi:adenosylmethionine-8-amino-7-oxononanoate aminotransferase